VQSVPQLAGHFNISRDIIDDVDAALIARQSEMR
jgi:hypothetical protein